MIDAQDYVDTFSLYFIRTIMLPQIQGYVHPRFERVRQVFLKTFHFVEGRGLSLRIPQKWRVVDLWGGSVGWRRSRGTSMTLQQFSVTKGIVATSFLMLVDRGVISYDRWYLPIGELTFGKAEVRFRDQRATLLIADLLNHRSGLIGFRDELSKDFSR